MSDKPKVTFSDNPLEATPERGLLTIAQGDEGWGWQLRFYDKPFPRSPLKLRLGTVSHEVEAWEIVEEMRKVNVRHIVLTKEAYEDTFKALFDESVVPHELSADDQTLIARPWHRLKPDAV